MKNNSFIFKLFLSTAGLITFFHFLFHPVRVFGWQTSIFYLDEKFSLGAYFTGSIEFLTAFIALNVVLSDRKKRDKLLNGALGIFFFLLSFDEYFEIHEYLREVVAKLLVPSSSLGLLTQISWIFPFFLVIVSIFILLLYSVFTEHNKYIKKLFLIGMSLYVFVLVLEVVGGMLYGYPVYIIFVGLEEGAEMIAASVFLYAMMEKLGQK